MASGEYGVKFEGRFTTNNQELVREYKVPSERILSSKVLGKIDTAQIRSRPEVTINRIYTQTFEIRRAKTS